MAIAVTAIVPLSDRIAGGITATILGSGFVATPTVTINGVSATSVAFVSATKLTCVVPAGAAGAQNVVVTNPDTTNATLVNGFTYYTPFADLTAVHIDIGGRDAAFDYGSIAIQRSSSQEQATFRVEDQTVPPFSPVKIGLGSLATGDLLFIGKEQVTKQSAKVEILSNPLWDCTVAGSLAEFNRMLAWGTYVDSGADVVAIDLIQKYAPDFTWAHIPSGLATVTTSFQGETMDSAFTQLKTLIGGYYYRDDSYDVHLFISETPDLTPDPLDAANQTLILGTLTWQADVSQIRNRVIGIGAGVAQLAAVGPGETIVPLQSVALFNTSGTVLIGTQRVTYTGVQVGGGGSLVGPGVAPSAAPTVAAVAGSGLGTGVYKYAYTDVTAAGESLPSPLGTVDTSARLADPTNAPTLGFSGGTAIIGGSTYSWAYTWITGSGETLPSPLDTVTPGGSGPYMGLVQIPIGPTGTTGRKIYRTTAGGSQLKLSGTVANNSSTQYNDNVVDGSLGVNAPSSNTAVFGNQVTIAGIAIGASPTTSRKVYRTAVGGSQLKLQQTIADNTATVGVQDATADGSLGANAPTSDTSGISFAGGQVNAGSTSLLTASPAPFQSGGGWALSPSKEPIRYTGITGNTLTGIPASGEGSILTTLLYGDQILPAPALTGVPASGAGSIQYTTIDPNTFFYANAYLYSERDNLTSQAAVKALEGGKSTGIYEFKITDSSFVTQASLDARCDAELLLFSDAGGILQANYQTFDKKSRYGRPLHVAMPWRGLYDPAIYDPAIYEAEQFLTGDFVIQTVSVTDVGVYANSNPRFTCMASSLRYTLEDLLRHVVVGV